MKIKISKSIGYCMGVRRAMDMALKKLGQKRGFIYTHGPLIHNPQALKLLAGKGLKIYETNKKIELKPEDTLIIRAHGLPPAEKNKLLKYGCQIVDATCPRVLIVQKLVKRYSAQNYHIIIWGSEGHPEVIGLKGYSNKQDSVIKNAAEIENLPSFENVILVSQTTQSIEKWPEIVEAVSKKWPHALIFNTICEATINRQKEVGKLASEVEAMIIVGGKDSGNTQRLAQLTKNKGIETLLVEEEYEIDFNWLKKFKTIGVTAGASTPNWMIKRVVGHLESFRRDKNSSFVSFFRRFLRVLVLSNMYVAAGAGALGLAMAVLAQHEPNAFYFSLFFCQVHAMHTLNVFCDKAASKFNDPERALFLEKYRFWLMLSGFFTGFGALTAAHYLGFKVLILFIIMSILGVLFSLPILPAKLAQKFKCSRLKDMPASKAASVAAGWAFLITIPPYLASEKLFLDFNSLITLFLVGLLVFLNVFIRGTLLDILEVQGDRIFGRETLPIIFGEKKALKILKGATILWALILIGGFLTNLWPSVAILMLISPIYYIILMRNYHEHYSTSSITAEALLDAPFYISGLLALIWYII